MEDGIYRGNCLLPQNETLLDSVRDRSPEGVSTIYYCGDHSIPIELSANFNVISHQDFLSKSDLINIIPNTDVEARDLWSLVDYFVCQNIPLFIGNSVSTFSALQILIRNGQSSFWYNTGSIPLAMIVRAFAIPLVYTYTELSATSGKYLLTASIKSALKIMPHNPIHILYHGDLDVDFIHWLHKAGTHIHKHNPLWKADVEEMRKNGNVETSHLFLHEGKLIGAEDNVSRF